MAEEYIHNASNSFNYFWQLHKKGFILKSDCCCGDDDDDDDLSSLDTWNDSEICADDQGKATTCCSSRGNNINKYV